VFLNERGLRSGWSALLFAAIYVLSLFSAETLAYGLLQPDPRTGLGLGRAFLIEAVQAIGLPIATLVMARLEGRAILAYGFQGNTRGARLVSGLLCGFAAITALVFTLWKARLLTLDGIAPQPHAALRFALGWGMYFLLVGIFEEGLLRGYVQYALTRGIGFWWSALLLSVLFGLEHQSNRGEGVLGLCSAGAVGLVFCLSLWYTGSLWWAVGFHAAWDWGQSFFFGTADSGLLIREHLLTTHPSGSAIWSGGATGPEGSLLIFPFLLLIAVCMVAWWQPRVRSPFRQESPLQTDAEESYPAA